MTNFEKLYQERIDREEDLAKVTRDQEKIMPLGNSVAVIGVIIWVISLFSMGALGIVLTGAFILAPAILFRQFMKHGGEMQIMDAQAEIEKIDRRMGGTL